MTTQAPPLNRNPKTLTILTAHPDDELLFFLGWMRTIKPEKLRIVCATGQFAKLAETRLAELAASAKHLGAELINLGLMDTRPSPPDPAGAPLDCQRLAELLAELDHNEGDPVLTHGPLGEYGHRHHINVFEAACIRFGADVWCAAGPLEIHENLPDGLDIQAEKRELLRSIHVSQKNVADCACAHEPLCHVASSRYAPLFTGQAIHPPELAEDFIACLESRYTNPARRLPAVLHAILEVWTLSVMEQMLLAQVDYWRKKLATA